MVLDQNTINDFIQAALRVHPQVGKLHVVQNGRFKVHVSSFVDSRLGLMVQLDISLLTPEQSYSEALTYSIDEASQLTQKGQLKHHVLGQLADDVVDHFISGCILYSLYPKSTKGFAATSV